MNEISIGIISSICFLYLAFRRNQKISSSLILDIFALLLTNREKVDTETDTKDLLSGFNHVKQLKTTKKFMKKKV